MCWQVFRAKFVERQEISRDGLGQLASEIGLSAKALLNRLDAPQIAKKHQNVMERTLTDGVFGAPAFVVNGQLVWGNDRLVLVDNALTAPR